MKTPQEKKRLSYAKDRRNRFGENSKASRKAIPLRKALDLRAERHAQDKVLAQSKKVGSAGEFEELENELRATPRRKWRKSPDRPLGEVVPKVIAQRSFRVGSRIARRKKARAA